MIYLSYFYHVRFMPENMIPISTAVWDPKWFHDFKGQLHTFTDSRGIINGLREPQLVPGPLCKDDCRGPETCESKDPDVCPFLRHYRQQLDGIDFDSFMEQYKMFQENGYDICFLFHETFDNPCSERVVVEDWFKEHNVEVKYFYGPK